MATKSLDRRFTNELLKIRRNIKESKQSEKSISRQTDSRQMKYNICLQCQELRNLEKELERLDQLNVVGEVAASIGHEIRNPLTTIRGFLKWLSDKKEVANYQEYFNLMIEELDRANGIITEFLSVARKDGSEYRRMDLNEIIRAITTLIEVDALSANKQVSLKLNEVPKLKLDEKGIRQIILNLARNGLEAMQAGGVLTISTLTEGNSVILSIKDQGKGIPPELVNQLGTPFVTSKKGGTGLGLPVCYKIAARHDAGINFNTSAEGTTFFISFKIK